MCLFLNCGTKAQCLFAYNLSEKGVALWLQISFSALFIHSFIHMNTNVPGTLLSIIYSWSLT